MCFNSTLQLTRLTLIVGLFIVAIVIVIGVIGILSDFKPSTYFTMLYLSMFVFSFFAIFVKFKEKEIIKEAQVMIKNGADVYLNGQLINGEKITLKQYYITIEDNEVILEI